MISAYIIWIFLTLWDIKTFIRRIAKEDWLSNHEKKYTVMKKLSLLLMGGCLFGLSVVGCKESAPYNRYVNKWIGRQG